MSVLLGINYWMKKLFRGNIVCFYSKTNKIISFRIICFSVLIFFSLASCSTLKSYGKHEKRWAYLHPFAAVKLKNTKKKCDIIYSAVKDANSLDSYENGGKLDAFRHMFYMSVFAVKVSPNKVRKLGIAHEKDNYISFLKSQNEDGEKADSLSCEMDLLNNEIGIGLAKTNGKKISAVDLRTICMKQINDGNAYFMKRDSLGNYLTCAGEKINFELYKNKWNVPKCLVRN